VQSGKRWLRGRLEAPRPIADQGAALARRGKKKQSICGRSRREEIGAVMEWGGPAKECR